MINKLLNIDKIGLSHQKFLLEENKKNSEAPENNTIKIPLSDSKDDKKVDPDEEMISYNYDVEKDKFQDKLEKDLIAEIDGDNDEEMEQTARKSSMSIQIHNDDIEIIRSTCQNINFPLLEEYDFKRDLKSPNLPIEMKAIAKIRPYQEMALSKMFSNGRARSGIIVLPCGAGKTLVGITATSTVKKRTLVLCTSCVSVEQWYQQYELWSTIDMKKVIRFSSDHNKKEIELDKDEAHIVITTYSMMGQGSSESTMKFLDFMKSVEWGLLLLDEVQVVPATMFRKVLSTAKSHCKLGLTATLVREDEKIKDLNYLIGPKLYEANWLDLQNNGYLARVQCIEVWCEMTPEYYKQYLSLKGNKRILTYVNNPIKCMTCHYLINLHEKRGDKIIVFSDNLLAVEKYARLLKKPFIHSKVPEYEKQGILHYFKNTDKVNTIILSKVGDTSIDLPGANVIIQISSHFASRRQEAQRLGRILRPKSSNKDKFNAFFYSLCSKNTKEMYYAHKRQQFLVDQGYSFTVVKEMPFMQNKEEMSKLHMSSKDEQIRGLEEILGKEDSKQEIEEEDAEVDKDQRAMNAVNRQIKIVNSNGNTNQINILGTDGYYDEDN